MKRKVSVFIHRPTKAVRFKKNVINTPLLQKLNDFGLIFSVNMVTTWIGDEGKVAISFVIFDSDLKQEPFMEVNLFNLSEKKKIKKALSLPKIMFEPFESNVFTLQGEYTQLEIENLVAQWNKESMPKPTMN